MNIFLMEMEAKSRYKDFQRQIDTHRLTKQMKAQHRAQNITTWRNFTALMRNVIAGGRRLEPQG